MRKAKEANHNFSFDGLLLLSALVELLLLLELHLPERLEFLLDRPLTLLLLHEQLLELLNALLRSEHRVRLLLQSVLKLLSQLLHLAQLRLLVQVLHARTRLYVCVNCDFMLGWGGAIVAMHSFQIGERIYCIYCESIAYFEKLCIKRKR